MGTQSDVFPRVVKPTAIADFESVYETELPIKAKLRKVETLV